MALFSPGLIRRRPAPVRRALSARKYRTHPSYQVCLRKAGKKKSPRKHIVAVGGRKEPDAVS
jgi:hypothetical protein